MRTVTPLPLNACIKVPFFTSFQIGLVDPCPPGKTPDVVAFSSTACDGTGVDAGVIPSNRSPGECVEVVASVGGRGLVSVGGNSARFQCG